MAMDTTEKTSGAVDTFRFDQDAIAAHEDANGVLQPAQPGGIKTLNQHTGIETGAVLNKNQVHIEEIHGPQYRYRHGFEYQETRGNNVDLRYKEATADLPDRAESLEGYVNGAAHSEQHMVKILAHIETAITMLNEVYGSSYSLHKGDKQDVHIGDQVSFHKGDRFTYEEGHGDSDAAAVSWGGTKEFNYGNSFTINYVDKSPSDHTTAGAGPINGKAFDAAAAELAARPFLHSYFITESAALVDVTIGDKYEQTTGLSIEVHNKVKQEFLLGGRNEMALAGTSDMHLGGHNEVTAGLINEMVLGAKSELVVGPKSLVALGPDFEAKSMVELKAGLTTLKANVTEIKNSAATKISNAGTAISNQAASIANKATEIKQGAIALKNRVLDVS